MEENGRFCWLCSSYVTETHLASSKHQHRVASPADFLTGPGREYVPADVVQRWREAADPAPLAFWETMEDKGRFCWLCSSYVTEKHLASSKHQHRVASPAEFLTGLGREYVPAEVVQRWQAEQF